MQQFTVDDIADSKKLVRTILTQYPALTIGQVRQALRRKDIRVNGKREKADVTLHAGDEVTVYLPDDVLAGSTDTPFKEQADPLYQVVYQDDQIIIVNKRSGVTVQAAGNQQGPYLIDQLREDFQSSSLELCHRLDRQTGGLLIIARSPKALEAAKAMIRSRRLVKRYQCLIKGVPNKGSVTTSVDGAEFFECHAWLEKVSATSNVYIHDRKQSGDLEIVTRYRVMDIYPGVGPEGEPVSRLEIELVTGRTHQIRAHMAHLGHPLLGDGKYGRNNFNRHFRGKNGPLSSQQLYATALLFEPRLNGPLAKLAGRTVEVKPKFEWQAPRQ